ncbi:hypothetical protein [Rhodoferax mekongensis]|uniref:Uncharacterized protein n=1 Tax=Rhodoferax mekongensis TaxID=3068341 RepID=A0ABZ0AWF7_9BURK|nr:hypothetical protein [Rhodoferax sp. TBRC 17307]WNO03974.1 hypothetical protein RAN89_13785 [Rhodoferax sp. TBRC 17307]
MNTELQVKVAGTALSRQISLPNLLSEIYISLYANTLAFKASMRSGIAIMSGRETGLVACDLLKISSLLLKTVPDFPIDDANTLQQFSDFIQRKVLDFVQTKESGEPIGSNSLQKELAKCRDISLHECRFIIGQAGDTDESHFFISEVAKEAISTGRPEALRGIWTQVLAAKAFLLRAVELFAEALQGIGNSKATDKYENFRKYRAFDPLLWVADTLFDTLPEEEINSLESLDIYFDVIRAEFPLLNSQSTSLDEHCIELLEQCLSEARVAGVAAFRMTLVAVMAEGNTQPCSVRSVGGRPRLTKGSLRELDDAPPWESWEYIRTQFL